MGENKRRKINVKKQKQKMKTAEFSSAPVTSANVLDQTTLPMVPPGLEPVQPRLDSSVLQPLESRSSLLMNSPAATVSTLESVKLSLSRASEISSASNSLKKPKKGQSTAKQRLGKILKLKF